MKDKDIEQTVYAVIREYDYVLKNAARRSFIIPDSNLPRSKKVIKNAIKTALLAVDDLDRREQLKSSYISLANFVSDEEAKELEKIPPGLFSFLEMDEDKKKEFLRDRFKSGVLGDYEQAMKITRKVAGEQKRLRRDMEKY